MATIHYAANCQFQVTMPDGSKPRFSNLINAIAFCNYLQLRYILTD